MPVSLCEWRVRTGRFVHSVREYVIRERKEKLLKERIRRLKLLQERLLEKRDKSEDECESKPNDLSVKVDNAQNKSNIIDSDTTNDSNKEERGRSEFTIRDKYTFPFFFTLLLSLFSLMLSLIFFFVFDFSNLLASYKSFLKWSYCSESSRRIICLMIIIIIVCCSLAYCGLPYVINYNEDLQENLVLIRDENAKAKPTIKDINTSTESNNKENNIQPESAIRKNYTLTNSRIKEKNATDSAKEQNNIPTNATIKEINTPSVNRDGPLESIQSKTKIPKRKTIKEKNTTTELTIGDNSTLPESSVKDNIAPKECHIDTPSTITKRKTTTEKKTVTESTIKANLTQTKSNIITDNNARTKSTIKYNNPVTEPTMQESSTFSTIKYKLSKRKLSKRILSERKLSKRKLSKRKITEYKTTATKSKIKGNTTTTESTIKDNNPPTESTIKKKNYTATSVNKGGNVTTECTITNSNTPTQSTIKENNVLSKSTFKENTTLTESTIKVHNTTAERTINCNDIKTESTIKDRNSTSESTIKDYNRTSKSTIKDSKTPYESTIKDYNARIGLSTKDNTSSIQCAVKDKNTTSDSTIKGNNSTSESPIKDSKTTNKPAIRENNIPSRTPTEENNNQPMKVTIAQAEYTIRSGTQKVLSDGKHGISSQIPSCLKGTTDDPVMQESTCLPEMILVKAGDVEQNPGPCDRSANVQEQELVHLAYDISPSKYAELCIALGVSYTQSEVILDRHRGNVTRSLIEILCEWKNRQRDGTDCRIGIAAALCSVNLNALGDKMSRGGYLPQEAAPTVSMASEKDTLTTEQVTRCGDDFKTHYRTNLFKIKTDPLDFQLVLEFERIYTDLVLLRNEQEPMEKIPLDYKELLKTKVNGELPKRLMVEGEGGAGKTTFCTKMAWDWTNGADNFQAFVWVLVIHLRDIERNQTVGDIAKTYLSDSNPVQPHQIDEYILANPSKVFIILDGLDEYGGDLVKEGNDIAKIIRSAKFMECRVLVTTRPWKADQIKSNANFMNKYVYIAVAGFDKGHISIYINKYFADDPLASRDLIKLIEDNDVIQENLAPFPIYIAMLCILWRDSDSKKRELICRLKTFSQLFQEIIISLKDHYVSKQITDLDIETVTQYKQLDFCFSQIGKIALNGIMNKKFVYEKDDFSSCEESMETCCKVGVLSHEIRLVRRQDRHNKSTNLVKSNVFFPHKLFQEYLAGMYLASLFESDHEQYEKAMNDVIQRAVEFRYLLYFTASLMQNVATDVTSRLIEIQDYRQIVVDVTFEAYNENVAKVVGQHIFTEQKSLEIDDRMSAHTVSGYLFIMDKLTMETLIVSRRSCGPTISRDLADVICSSTALTALKLYGTVLHDNFYGILESEVKTSKIERLTLGLMELSDEHAPRNLARFLNNLPRLKDLTLQRNRFDGMFYTELASGACSKEVEASGHSIRKVHLDHRCHNDILQHGFTVEMLFPNLEHLRFIPFQTVSPHVVRSLAHSELKKLSFGELDEDYYDLRKANYDEDMEYHVSLVGDPSSLEQVFSNPFPLLTSLTLRNLVIGNNRCKIILSSLKKHQHLKNLCFIHCYTDEELDPIVSAINMENRMKVNIQHSWEQKRLKCRQMSSSLADALCHRTSIQELVLTKETIFPNAAWFSDENQRTVDSMVQRLSITGFCLKENNPLASRDLARFVCLQPCLIDLTIGLNDMHTGLTSLQDEFYHELARLASSSKVVSKVKKISITSCNLAKNVPLASRDLARFLCLQPCLIDLTIGLNDTIQFGPVRLHDKFFHELARLASSSKVQKICVEGCNLEKNDPSASRDLARFLCLQPCLIDLTIGLNAAENCSKGLHEEFYHELARLVSFSKVQKLSIKGCNLEKNDPSASRDLARFICLQPCLIDLKIGQNNLILFSEIHLHDEFYHELAHLAPSLKVQKLSLKSCKLKKNDQSASRDIARFLCLQPCLIDLTIELNDPVNRGIHQHDEFYHELALLASSSKVQKLSIECCTTERNDPSASRDLARFLCHQPCLIDLTIMLYNSAYRETYLCNEFYHELARIASSSKVKKMSIEGCKLEWNDPTASRDLARFICIQPCLIDLTIGLKGPGYREFHLHDEFYREIVRLASSSKVQRFFIRGGILEKNDPSASRDLARFLCLQPCLIDLTIGLSNTYYERMRLPDEFYHEFARLACSSKVQKLSIEGCRLKKNNTLASRDLARFLCLQPCLIDLKIGLNDTRFRPTHPRESFHELARLASSSKVQKLSIGDCNLRKNDPSASRDLAWFLCIQPCLIDLTIGLNANVYVHDEFYHELARLAFSLKVLKLSIGGCNMRKNDPSASRDLARFFCLQPCLIDLTIGFIDTHYSPKCVHDEFYHELARLASSSKVQHLSLEGCNLEKKDPSASRDLASFLCLQPCLIDLTIGLNDRNYGPTLFVHDAFYHEFARLASSSKVQKLSIEGCNLQKNDPSASRDLARFLCLQPCLIDLSIQLYTTAYRKTFLHDTFYHELAQLGSSSKIQTVNLDYSPSNVFTLVKVLSHSASKQLAKFLCSLPLLTTLAIKGNECLHDDFFTELASLAASSQNPYFREKEHISMLQEWSVRKQQRQQQQQQGWLEQHRQQQQLLEQQRQQQQQQWLEKQRQQEQQQRWLEQQRQQQQLQQQRWLEQQRQQQQIQQQQQQLNQCERPMPSTHQQPYLPHHVPLLESAQPSGQFQSFHHRGIQSEPEQIIQSTTYQQHSHITPFQSTSAPDQLTEQHLEEFDQYLQSYLSDQHNASNGHETQYSNSQETQQHSPHHGLGEATQDNAVSQRQEDATPIETDDTSLSSSSEYINSRTSLHHGGMSIGMKPFYENDDNLAMP